MSRTTTLCAAAGLMLAVLVRAVVGQEPTPAPPFEEFMARGRASSSPSGVVPTAGETGAQGESVAQGPAFNAPAAEGIPGYPSVKYPSTAFPSQAPPPEPMPPPDAPPGLLEGAESLYTDGIAPMVDATGEWFSSNWCDDSIMGPRKWSLAGWLNPGLSWNPDDPANNMNTPVAFNDRANEPMFNQGYIYLERRVDPNACTWDYGARIDLMYGSDSRFTQATGLELHQNNSPKWSGYRFYGPAMPQLFAEVAAPVANGMSVKVGHFYSIFGFERIMAPDNFFYSHSYARVYGMPATQTGGVATVYLKPNRFFKQDNIVLITGITQGWDTWGHQNQDLSWLFGFMMDIGELDCTFSGAFLAGQEPTTNLGPGFVFTSPTTDDRWSWDFILSKQFTDKLGMVIESVGGSQHGGVTHTINGVTTNPSEATWYGLCNYLVYEVNDIWSAAWRFEWFRDGGNYRVARTPTATENGLPFLGSNYFAFTMGMNYRPRANWLIRPEMRWDWSDIRGNAAINSSALRSYDDLSDGSQFLWSTDLIYSF